MADENFKKVQDMYVTLCREDEEGETEVMVDQLETLWVPFDKDEDQFEISLYGRSGCSSNECTALHPGKDNGVPFQGVSGIQGSGRKRISP